MSFHRGVLLVVLSTVAGVASGQSPGVIYTWAGTGNVQQWVATGDTNIATVANVVDGELTITETGDSVFGDPGGTFVIRDDFNRRLESSTATGGLDLTGLEFIEIDLAHNGVGNVSVQFFTQVTPAFTYTWAGSNGVRNGSDFSLGPGMHTIQYPIGLLNAAEQAYIRTIGLRVRDHFTEANHLTWTIKEVRSTGTPLTVRDLATHDPGTSENGYNGVLANFDRAAIVGNDGGANQSGMTVNPNGSLQWTDKGGTNAILDGNQMIVDPSGAAVGWGNGTSLFYNGTPNSFNERPTDLSNYTQVTFRMSATDPTNPDGVVGVQGYLQTGSAFTYKVAGEFALPTDGQFHDVVFPLSNFTFEEKQNTMITGFNLFAHETDLVINVDRVRLEMVEGVPGDYNGNGTVDAADYALWRDNFGQPASALKNRNPLNSGDVNQDDYAFWKLHFGEGSGSGAATAAVPEPVAWLLGLWGAACGMSLRRRSTC